MIFSKAVQDYKVVLSELVGLVGFKLDFEQLRTLATSVVLSELGKTFYVFSEAFYLY